MLQYSLIEQINAEDMQYFNLFAWISDSAVYNYKTLRISVRVHHGDLTHDPLMDEWLWYYICWGHYDVSLKWVTFGDPIQSPYMCKLPTKCLANWWYILPSSRQLGLKQRSNWRYSVGSTGCFYEPMWLPPTDYFHGLQRICDVVPTNRSLSEVEGILPKEPYLPCVSMAGRAVLAGYHRSMFPTQGACLGFSVPLEMGGFRRQNLVIIPYPTPQRRRMFRSMAWAGQNSY